MGNSDSSPQTRASGVRLQDLNCTVPCNVLAEYQELFARVHMPDEKRWLLQLIPLAVTVRFEDGNPTATTVNQWTFALTSYCNSSSLTVAQFLKQVGANPVHQATFTNAQKNQLQQRVHAAQQREYDMQQSGNACSGSPAVPDAPDAPDAPNAPDARDTNDTATEGASAAAASSTT